jgi:transglutaminase-like putative cysteine protease
MIRHTALTLANITWLLTAMAFVIAPHAMRLPLWVTACCVAAGALRWWIAKRAWHAPPWWLMALFAIGVLAGARVEYGRLFGREVGVTLLIVMLCLKILEMKMKRDAVLVVFLGFFLALTNFLYSQTILMGLYMLVCTWVFVATLIGFNRIGTEATVRERLVPAAWLIAQAVPMMLVLFFLFPRLSGPLWSMPVDDQSVTGLTDNMTPGDFNKLALNDAVAFRVDFASAVPQSEDRYWRGPVLSEQFGRTWRMPAYVPNLKRVDYVPLEPAISYRVTMQPSNKNWLFALDLPATIPDSANLTADYQLRATAPVTGLKSYEMQSHLRYAARTELGNAERLANLNYSKYLNPRSIAFAKQLRDEYPDPKALVEALFKLYNTQFEYTLEPPRYGPNPVDEFFFDGRKGYCEHYASSFVFILRAAGIPARIVTGYQGGEVNPITRQLIVRQSDAHAWAEVWFADSGWVRADPTFAVSPLRINRGMTAALGPQGVFNNLIEADKFGVLQQIRFGWDALNNQWNQWVVGFSADRQRSLMEDVFGLADVDWRALAIWLIGGVLATGGMAALFLMLRAYRTRKPPLVQAYDRFCAKMAKAGLVRAAHEGPMDFLRRIEVEHPAAAPEARRVTEAYVALRYAPPSDALIDVRTFAAMVRRFRSA